MAFGSIEAKMKGNGNLKKTKQSFSLWDKKVTGAEEDDSRS